MPDAQKPKNPWGEITWIGIAIVSSVWWWIGAQGLVWRLVLTVALSLASFMIGCLIGFLFTSYGEEASTVGKVRDWLIGGLTGLTIAKASAIKALLVTFAAGAGPSEFALAAGNSIVYVSLGFFFMFFQRELILNVLLAESRAVRGRVEGTKQAGEVTQRLLQALPASILSGIDDATDKVDAQETEKLRALLYSKDVQEFLDQAEEAVQAGKSVDWDVTSKAANLHYYRTYFEEEKDKPAQIEKACAWVQRALAINPQHVDLAAKYADLLGMLDRDVEAAAILERIEMTPEAPAYIEQWLGYYLLYVPNRVDDAIRYSERYHARFPDESDTFFNIAYGYGKKYCAEVSARGEKPGTPHQYRDLALRNLKEGLRAQPDWVKTVRDKWMQGKNLGCLLHDAEFRSLVGLLKEEDQAAS